MDGPRGILRPPTAGLQASVGAGASGVSQPGPSSQQESDQEEDETMGNNVWGVDK